MTIVTFLPRRFMASRVMTDTFFRAVACAPVMLFIVAMAVVAKHRRMGGSLHAGAAKVESFGTGSLRAHDKLSTDGRAILGA